MENTEESTEKLRIDEFTRHHLEGLSRWAVFLGTAGIFMSFLILVSVIATGDMIVQNMIAANPELKAMEGSGKVIIAVMGAMMLIPLFMSFYLLRSGRRLRLGIMHERQDYLNNSLYNLKLVFKIFGIFVIVFLALQILSSLAGLLGGA